MRTYKNYDVSENDLTRFLEKMSDLQADIKASSLITDGWWRFLLFVDPSDQEILDREFITTFTNNLAFNCNCQSNYERSFQHAHNE